MILSDSLRALKITESDVNKKLKANNTTAQNVFLMTLDRFDNICLIKKGK